MKTFKQAIKFKRSPFSLCNNVDRKILAGRIKEKPVWYHALQAFPMAPEPKPYLLPELTGRFGTDVLMRKIGRVQEKNASGSRRNNVGCCIKLGAIPMPKKIWYAEDDIRNRFYRSHPFELLQAKETGPPFEVETIPCLSVARGNLM